jgi:hypothetical protein
MAITDTEETIRTEADPEIYPACDGCGAPLDGNQRYCVVCGTKSTRATDPAGEYLQAARRQTRAAATAARVGPGDAPRTHSLGTAVAIAIVPLAVALGLLIGRSGATSDQQLINALRSERPQVVTVAGAAAAPATSTVSAGRARGAAATSHVPKRQAATPAGAVLASTSRGVAHQLAGTTVGAAQKSAGAQIVQQMSHQIGSNYTAAQQGLPDQIAVP